MLPVERLSEDMRTCYAIPYEYGLLLRRLSFLKYGWQSWFHDFNNVIQHLLSRPNPFDFVCRYCWGNCHHDSPLPKTLSSGYDHSDTIDPLAGTCSSPTLKKHAVLDTLTGLVCARLQMYPQLVPKSFFLM